MKAKSGVPSQFSPLPADTITAGVAVLPSPGLRLESGIPFNNWLGIGQRLAEAASNSPTTSSLPAIAPNLSGAARLPDEARGRADAHTPVEGEQ